MQALADDAASLGDVTQVIHTSGVSPSDTATENIMKINAAGTVNMVEAFYPVLDESGVMINFSSVAAYTMSKKFVIYFTQKNVARFAEKHCRILSISPGCYLTPMHQKLIDNQPETAENQLELIHAGRWGHPYEMGALTAFLCSPPELATSTAWTSPPTAARTPESSSLKFNRHIKWAALQSERRPF